MTVRLHGEKQLEVNAPTGGGPYDRQAVVISELTDSDACSWDAYVFQHRHGSCFHLLAWKRTIEETFSFKPVYLVARDRNRVCGVLPLFLVSNRLIGRVLMSTPFGVYGGILADSDLVRRGLYDYANALGAEMGCDYVEYRNAWPEQCVGAPNVSRYVAFHQELAGTEELLMASLPKKTRNMVRKALKSPFEMRTEIRDPRLFDQIHSRSMRRLGTPNFPLRYFERLLANFGDMADISEVWLDGKLMAAGLNLYFRRDVHTYHAAAETQYNSLGPNTFLYYEQIRQAGLKGFDTFDFGRCKKNTGVFEFKKHWNTVMRELPYEVVLINRKGMPNFTPQNPKFRLAIRAWRKLPLTVTRAVSRFVFPLFP